MPKSSSSKTLFRRSLLISGLVGEDQVRHACREVADQLQLPSAEDVTDLELAGKLIEFGCLTAYQTEQIRAGRTKLTLGMYVITDWIGEGGMGQVFKAVHKVMGRESAIKVLPLSKSTEQAILGFTREIRTQAQLDHTNLVRAYDAGHDGKVHYLVTEYVPGMDLRRLVRKHHHLSMKQAASVIMQAALGLQHAHERGLVHRDVKPGNILVTPEGVAKVSDLGLSAVMHDLDGDPRAGKTVGTADYLSPEQIRAPRDVTPSSDVYSLGCTLYYAVTGKVPFPGGSASDKARRHCQENPFHPRRFNSELTDEFVDIIADMMEKDPRERILSAAEVAARLEPLADDAMFVSSRRMAPSPWASPPPPSAEDVDEATETEASELFDSFPGAMESLSQVSQPTDAVASASEDTPTFRELSPERPELSPFPAPLARPRLAVSSHLLWAFVAALIGAVLVSLLVGGILGFLIRDFVK